MFKQRILLSFMLFLALILGLAPISSLAAPLPVLRSAPAAQASANTLPVVAIHVSALTQALEGMPASPPTPTGPGTSGYEWWYTSWHYFVMYESLEEALRSDGTPFVEVTDADIRNGWLINPDGSPRYPIVISLASEAISNDQVAPLRNYVTAGGFLFVGSSSFTRNPDGTTRTDFALAAEMGLHVASANLQNWYKNATFSKVIDHRLVAHIPTGDLSWNMPLAADEISWGVTPIHQQSGEHYAWQVTTTDPDVTVIANGRQGLNLTPILATKRYGAGRFIYHGAFQPLIGHGGFDSGMYAYGIYRNAIEWAFDSANLPIVKLSPWRYAYDAAFVVRHDVENRPELLTTIDESAAFEFSQGARGDYYLCTGTLRAGSEDTQLTEQQKLDTIASLRQAVSQLRATIGSHNGGLSNPVPVVPPLLPTDYDYWHWGPDEALDTNPPGYANGRAYASASIAASFQDIEGWMSTAVPPVDNGRTGCGATNNCPRIWAAPYFNGTREDSQELIEQLGVITAGEQKISPFPHWTLSYNTPGAHFDQLTLPVSDWYVGTRVAQTKENHTTSSIREAIDFYHSLGALINVYGHQPSDSNAVAREYVVYGMSRPNVWATNAVGVYDWWVARSGVTVTPGYSENGATATASAAVAGATDPETAIEIVIPNWNTQVRNSIVVRFDGALAAPANYRINNYGVVKARVGATVHNVQISYHLSPVVRDIPNQTIIAGAAFAAIPLDNYVSDADNTDAQMTWTYSGNSQLTVNIVNRVATISTPSANWNGAETITFRATDPDGYWGADEATFTVRAAPVVSDIPDQTIAEGAAFATIALDDYVSDMDNTDAQLTWTYTGNTALTVSINSNRVATIGIPNADWTGAETITFRATDPGALYAENSATFTVTAVNDAPVVTDIPNQTIAEGAAFATIALDGYVSDVDNTDAQLAWTYTGNTALSVSIVGNRVATIGIPNADWTGAETITFRATDPGALYAEDSATFTVTAVNDAPVVTDIPNQTIAEGAAFATIALDGYVSDVDNTDAQLAWTYTGNTALSVSIVGRVATIGIPNADWTGAETITFRATDPGALYAENSATFTVTAVNDAPVVTDIPDQTIAEGAAFATIALDGYVSDVDNTDAQLAWTYTGNTALSVSIVGRVATIGIPNADWTGAETITFRATDPGALYAENSATFTVMLATPGNDAPVVSDIPNQTVAEGAAFATISLDDYVFDVDNTDAQLAWTYTGNTALSVSIVGRVATIGIPNPDWTGAETITFRATDPGALYAENSATFTVTAVNDAPVVTDIPNQTIAEGAAFATIALDGYVSDVDNTDAQLAWTYTGNTALSVSIVGRVATIGIPNADWTGAETITFRATDPGALHAEDSATFTVTAVNDAPVVTDIPNQTIAQGAAFATIALDSYVSDVDNTDAQLTWTYSGNSQLTVSINSSRVATIGIPNANWTGAETITFRATDPGALWDEDGAAFTVEASVTTTHQIWLPLVLTSR